MSAGILGAIAVFLALVAIFASKTTKPRPVDKMPEPSADARALVRQGLKIEAIKLYRQESGASLLEAQQVIDRLS